ncbi:MAG TPA: CsbD family protein [Solirubrobacteraceae bacterium]|nr:CsbD family protein [Solirubrobacteraceae bacterium]
MSTDKNVDEGKGRLKEAAGSLTDDDDLKDEGKVDRAKASVKDKVDRVADKAKDALDQDKD